MIKVLTTISFLVMSAIASTPYETQLVNLYTVKNKLSKDLLSCQLTKGENDDKCVNLSISIREVTKGIRHLEMLIERERTMNLCKDIRNAGSK